MLSKRLRGRIGSANNPSPYALRNYRLHFHKRSCDGSAKCNIVETNLESDVVHGVLFDVGTSDVPILDKCEGAGAGYQRKLLTSDTFAYIADSRYIDESFYPYTWYIDLVVAGAEEHSLPETYVAWLKTIRSVPDPEPNRKARIEAISILDGRCNQADSNLF